MKFSEKHKLIWETHFNRMMKEMSETNDENEKDRIWADYYKKWENKDYRDKLKKELGI